MVLMFGACSGGRREQNRLSPRDSLFVERTLAAYDAFVRSKMGDELPIGEAYSRFFAETGQGVEVAGDMALFIPGPSFANTWRSDLAEGRMPNSIIEPSLAPNIAGVEKFGRKLTKKNRFWRDMTESVVAAGDFPPTYRAALVRGNDKIRFDDTHERFMAVIAFMVMTKPHKE